MHAVINLRHQVH